VPRVEAVELRRLRLPLRSPFRSAHGAHGDKDVLVVRVLGAGAEGWGECAALAQPTYTSEYTGGAQQVLREHLIPRLLRGAGEVAGGDIGGQEVAGVLAGVKGHPMAKAALEMAVLDAELRDCGVSLAERLGGTRTSVQAGVALGMASTVAEVVTAAEAFVAEGYRRVKLKIAPGWDVSPVTAVRAALGTAAAVQVDANGAYAGAGLEPLGELDRLGLALIEQPLAPRDLRGHAQLAGRLRTPLCLDESIEGVADAEVALDLGACSIVNIKPGRCGGLFEAVRVHDLCMDRRVPVWCGGMLETGIGRAANLALASLPGFSLPGDLSASDRYFDEDLTEPFVLQDGCLWVPTGPGLGVEPAPEALARFTTSVELIG